MKLNVVLVSNQVRGIDGTGGLGDVASALPKELMRHGNVDVRVLMPGYKEISAEGLGDRFDTIVVGGLRVPFGDGTVKLDVCKYSLPKIQPSEPDVICYLLRADQFDKASDSPQQAVLLGRATVEFLRSCQDFRVDVVHCNDWHTALIPLYLNAVFGKEPYLGRIATLYTTHNTGDGYQGSFPTPGFPLDAMEVISLAGLHPSDIFVAGQTRSLEHRGQVNLAKGGFGFADLLTTVSLQYAREILTPAFAGGLDGLFLERSSDLCGIVDGIDTVEWDPAHDDHLPEDCRYGTDEPVEHVIVRKRKARQRLRNWRDNRNIQPFRALRDDSTLGALVGRIADQKVRVLLPVLPDICQLPNVQLSILGNAHPKDLLGQELAREMWGIANRQPNLMFHEGFDPRLSHLMYAAADFFLVPSTYEPCGLTQLIAMRYGTVPVVRFVGGLVDTVIDEKEGLQATGFGFAKAVDYPRSKEHFESEAQRLFETVTRAVETQQARPNRWAELVTSCIARDSSWGIPARQYVKLYQEAVSRRVRSSFFPPRFGA